MPLTLTLKYIYLYYEFDAYSKDNQVLSVRVTFT